MGYGTRFVNNAAKFYRVEPDDIRRIITCKTGDLVV